MLSPTLEIICAFFDVHTFENVAGLKGEVGRAVKSSCVEMFGERAVLMSSTGKSIAEAHQRFSRLNKNNFSIFIKPINEYSVRIKKLFIY